MQAFIQKSTSVPRGTLTLSLLALLLGACGQNGGEPASQSTLAPTFEAHMANVRAWLGGARINPQWTSYPNVNPYCQSGQCRGIAWIGATENLESGSYNSLTAYTNVVFRSRSYGQGDDPGNYAYVTAAMAATGATTACNDDDRILSFNSPSVAGSAAGPIRVKRDWWYQDKGLSYIVWRDGWIDMCKGSSYPDAQEFKK